MKFLKGLNIILLFCYAHVQGQSDYTISWADDILTIYGDRLPGGELKTWYLEAYCRPGSTDRDWNETVIGHKTKLISQNKKSTKIKLLCTLSDGVEVVHQIRTTDDGVEFKLKAKNKTTEKSHAHWAQPCIRLGEFTGTAEPADKYAYLEKSFIFLDGKIAMMPTKNWATEARYTPGQVWRPSHVPHDDVNPRPLSIDTPSNGLIGCISGDESMLMATAWEPYQELFQGIIRCLHSDFRIGGLSPGETKVIRGKIYLIPNDVDALLAKYALDFPEQITK